MGVAQPGTHGFFLNEYNVPGRTIVGISNFSPAYFLREDQASNDPVPLEHKLPDVYSWSDVVWVGNPYPKQLLQETRNAELGFSTGELV